MSLATRIVAVTALGAALSGITGCLATAVQAVTAPQSLAAGAANQVASSTSSTVAQMLGPPSGYEQTVSDIDRILLDHGDAENAGALRSLRQRLEEQPGRSAPSRASAWPAPASEYDRRTVPAATSAEYQSAEHGLRLNAPKDRSHTLVLDPPEDPGFAQTGPRQISVPFMPPRTSSLPDEVPRWYQLDSRPIRLGAASTMRHD